jgi:hypothetical protein
MKLKTFRIGSKPVPGAGIRLGVVRFLPRSEEERLTEAGAVRFVVPGPRPQQAAFATRERNLFPRYRAEILKNSESGRFCCSWPR